MFRIVGAIFLGGLLASFVFNGSQTMIVLGMIVAGVLVVTPLALGTSALRCPACRKRVKLGATACHHCGRAVVEARAEP